MDLASAKLSVLVVRTTYLPLRNVRQKKFFDLGCLNMWSLPSRSFSGELIDGMTYSILHQP